jgi:hypothetical protein
VATVPIAPPTSEHLVLQPRRAALHLGDEVVGGRAHRARAQPSTPHASQPVPLDHGEQPFAAIGLARHHDYSRAGRTVAPDARAVCGRYLPRLRAGYGRLKQHRLCLATSGPGPGLPRRRAPNAPSPAAAGTSSAARRRRPGLAAPTSPRRAGRTDARRPSPTAARKSASQAKDADEAIHTFEGTETIQNLIVGRDITGASAFA